MYRSTPPMTWFLQVIDTHPILDQMLHSILLDFYTISATCLLVSMYRSTPMTSLVCVCVSLPFILDIKFVGRTSRDHTGGRSHVIFLARRIQPFLSFVDREVEFCVLTIYRCPLVGHSFFFLVRKILLTGIELTSQRVRRLRDYL